MIWNFLTIKQRPFDFFFEICTKEPFAFQTFSNERNVKDQVLLMLLNCIVVVYSNGNFTGRLFSNYGPLNILPHFFDISFMFFTRLLSKRFWRNYPFSAQISRYSILRKIKMSNFVILKWQPFTYKVKKWKLYTFLGLFFQK